MIAPNPSHWTLNSCFGALHSVWVHLGSFRNCMKIGTKRAQLVKVRGTNSHRDFLQRSHRIHSIGPKTHVLVHCIVFGTIWDRFVTT